MPVFSASAPGKIILFGEHAVVYGRPAVAIPVTQVQANVTLIGNPLADKGKVVIHAPDIGLDANLNDLSNNNPLVCIITGVLETLNIERLPALTININSTIPVAAGMGSGAAVSIALIRSLSAFLGHPLPEAIISSLAYEAEKIYHGTPSGIDNSVITYEKPVYFIKGRGIETLHVGHPLIFLVGDTGISSPTASVVRDIQSAWQEDSDHYDKIFDSIGNIAQSSRKTIENGTLASLGTLMIENHALLQILMVSSVELDRLVQAALSAGAYGAKLSGGGRGGNMIALVDDDNKSMVAHELLNAGAKRIIVTEIRPKIS